MQQLELTELQMRQLGQSKRREEKDRGRDRGGGRGGCSRGTGHGGGVDWNTWIMFIKVMQSPLFF